MANDDVIAIFPTKNKTICIQKTFSGTNPPAMHVTPQRSNDDVNEILRPSLFIMI